MLSDGDFGNHSVYQKIQAFAHEEYVEVYRLLPIHTEVYENLSSLQASDENLGDTYRDSLGRSCF